jgi:GAG-pre-integrase domain
MIERYCNAATKTVPIDAQNVFTFTTAPGHRSFTTSCMQVGDDPVRHDNAPDTMPCVRELSSETVLGKDETDFLPSMEHLDRTTKTSAFNRDGYSTPQNNNRITRATLDKQRRKPTAELLRMHYKFGHISFSRLRAMVKSGVLPKALGDCPLPECPACLYGKAKRRPVQTKAKRSVNPVKTVREPGD